jgi:RNA polymerase sigma-70 factor (ECF subfamily)
LGIFGFNLLLAVKRELNETELLDRLVKDDQLAYRELFEYYYHRLFGLAMVITKSRELSEEIVSDVFIALWRRRSHAVEIENLRLYLYVAIRNTAYNYLERLTKTATIPLDQVDFEPSLPFANPEQAYVTKEMNQRLQRAIEALPPRCRMIFRLIREDGLSYKEAATLLNLSVGTIDNQLVIAVRKLSQALFYTFSISKKKS